MFLHRLLTTPSRWANWTASCYSIFLPGWVPPFRRWRYLIYSGTRATSRKELPSHTGRTSISQQVIFLPLDNAHVLTSDAKWLANQTYDEVTMMGIGREFNIERTSSTLFTGFDQGIPRSCQPMSQASPVVPAPRRLPSVRAARRARLVSRAPRMIPAIIRKAGRTSGPSSVVRLGTLVLSGSRILILHIRQALSVPLFRLRSSLSWGSFTCDIFVNRKRNNRCRIQSDRTHYARNPHPGCAYT